ncbi:hypothetical protein DCCM_0381 [Desulfocucumis palustris]|uniref:Uncharacterized protein n=1 Tax=Desulfocucumis palustris TaxID=1898651 RepID=A0A2L2X844_9FIRM|nr:hypothetical protein [Desulfocucumis palustris]GBF32190.1 hypothetical protein DCCM_0381 [Desulfocucumis palustris]
MDNTGKEEDGLSQIEADRIERVIFEDDDEIILRDGKKYKIPPCSLKDARELIRIFRTINVDLIIVNFIPTGKDDEDEQRVRDFYRVMKIAFKDYPGIDQAYLEKYVDLKIARKVINSILDLNEIKKK